MPAHARVAAPAHTVSPSHSGSSVIYDKANITRMTVVAGSVVGPLKHGGGLQVNANVCDRARSASTTRGWAHEHDGWEETNLMILPDRYLTHRVEKPHTSFSQRTLS